MEELVTTISLDPPEEKGANVDPTEDFITVSTVHSAKGLEWGHVFVCNCTDGKFPNTNAEFGGNLEEERRLM